MSTALLLLGVFWGSLGLGYFIYGKKESMAMPMLVGVALMVYPYFVYAVWENVLLGIVLCVLPFILRF